MRIVIPAIVIGITSAAFAQSSTDEFGKATYDGVPCTSANAGTKIIVPKPVTMKESQAGVKKFQTLVCQDTKWIIDPTATPAE
jgi:hypothetical protein